MAERMTDAEVGYLAGLLDANGSVWVYRHQRRSGIQRHLRMKIYGLTFHQGAWLKRFVSPKVVKEGVALYRAIFESPTEIAAIFANAYPHLIRLKPYAPLVFRFAKTANPSRVPLSVNQRLERAAVDREIELLRRGR